MRERKTKLRLIIKLCGVFVLPFNEKVLPAAIDSWIWRHLPPSFQTERRRRRHFSIIKLYCKFQKTFLILIFSKIIIFKATSWEYHGTIELPCTRKFCKRSSERETERKKSLPHCHQMNETRWQWGKLHYKMCSRLHRERQIYVRVRDWCRKLFLNRKVWVYLWKLDDFHVVVHVVRWYLCLVFLDIFTNVSVRSFPDIKTFPLAFVLQPCGLFLSSFLSNRFKTLLRKHHFWFFPVKYFPFIFLFAFLKLLENLLSFFLKIYYFFQLLSFELRKTKKFERNSSEKRRQTHTIIRVSLTYIFLLVWLTLLYFPLSLDITEQYFLNVFVRNKIEKKV